MICHTKRKKKKIENQRKFHFQFEYFCEKFAKKKLNVDERLTWFCIVIVSRCLCNSIIFDSSNMAAIFFESGTRTLFNLLLGLLMSPSSRPRWLSSSFNAFRGGVASEAAAKIAESSVVLLLDLVSGCGLSGMGWKVWLLLLDLVSLYRISSCFWLSAYFSCSSRSALVWCRSLIWSWSLDSLILFARISASKSPILSIKWSRSFLNICTSSLRIKFIWLWNADDAVVDDLPVANFWSLSSAVREVRLCITSSKFHSSLSELLLGSEVRRAVNALEMLLPYAKKIKIKRRDLCVRLDRVQLDLIKKFFSSLPTLSRERSVRTISMLTWTPADPAVDEALCASFEELVSVEKPESCMTLPLPSPLFGSFLPLCELLRLRVSSDDVWIISTPLPPLLLLPSLLPLLLKLLLLLFSLRRTRIPGSHSRLH